MYEDVNLGDSEYMNRLFFHATRADLPPDAIPQWAIKLTGCAAILLVTALCAISSKLGTQAAVVFTSVKLVALVCLSHFYSYSSLTLRSWACPFSVSSN